MGFKVCLHLGILSIAGLTMDGIKSHEKNHPDSLNVKTLIFHTFQCGPSELIKTLKVFEMV